jgi:hypothetical protein
MRISTTPVTTPLHHHHTQAPKNILYAGLGPLIHTHAIPKKAVTSKGRTAPARLTEEEWAVYNRLSALRDLKKEVDTHIHTLQTFRQTPTPSADLKAQCQVALDFFNALPAITPQTSPEHLVRIGAISRIPLGLDKVYATPRYVVGRPLLVHAPINTQFTPRTDFLKYKEDGPTAITYRATLRGEEGEFFWVDIDGASKPVKILKSDVAILNQPQTLADTKTSVQGIAIDYNDPWMKACVYQGYTHLAPLIHDLDFNSAFSTHKDGSVDILSRGKVLELQERALKTLHNMVHMTYGYGSGSAGELALHGKGVCFQQSTVLLALLAPFTQVLGLELQFIDGKNFRHGWKPGQPAFGGDHGWLAVTFRPSMQKRVSDRTWQDPSMSLDRAYSYHGDRYPLRLQLLGSGTQQEPLRDSDIACTEKLKIARVKRLYGDKGVHGRDHHQ